MRHWLMKTEPDVFSFDDLLSAPNGTASWDGVRNYQARNMMRDEFRVGDQVFIYHSRTDEPGIVGIAEVVRAAYPDHTALDPKSKYFDPKSLETGESRWSMVDVRAVRKLARPVSLQSCRSTPGLEGMALIRKGQRLSIQPVSKSEWKIICSMGEGADS